MLFEITTTSGSDPPCEKAVVFEKTSEGSCESISDTHIDIFVDNPTYRNVRIEDGVIKYTQFEKTWQVEIESLGDLLSLIGEVKDEIILSRSNSNGYGWMPCMPTIEVYDNYRE